MNVGKIKAIIAILRGARLPCDVKLPPYTTLMKGCQFQTLLTALEQRETYPEKDREFAGSARIREIQDRKRRQLADPNVPKMDCSECGRPVVLHATKRNVTGIICQDCVMRAL
jgi:hypothetical protein